MAHIKKFTESFIIGSIPLESSAKMRNKLSKLTSLLTRYEEIVISNIDTNSDDYPTDVNVINVKISNLLNSMDLDDLEIALEDCSHKYK